MDLLGDKNQDMMLEQVPRFVKAKEAGKRSASRLLLPQATDAVTGSSYRKHMRTPAKATPSKDQNTCTYCGTKGYGRSPPMRFRSNECPIFGTKCNHCDKYHHFEKVCRSAKLAKSTENEDAISDTIYARSRRRTAPRAPPWPTMSLTRSQGCGQRDDPNPRHTSGYG